MRPGAPSRENDMIGDGVPFEYPRSMGIGFACDIRDGLVKAQAGCFKLSSDAGWWSDYDPATTTAKYIIGTKIALIHSEVSEALEGVRKGEMDSHLPHRKAVEVELADALIRIFDVAGALQLDLAGALLEKLAYNQRRADHKPEARNAIGGKAI